MRDGPTKPRQDLRQRTRQHAIKVIRLYSSLPKSNEYQVIGKQFLRSGTSVGAQYSEAYRAKSNKDFISKIESALQELEETLYWLDLLVELHQKQIVDLENIKRETREFIVMFVTMVRNLKSV